MNRLNIRYSPIAMDTTLYYYRFNMQFYREIDAPLALLANG